MNHRYFISVICAAILATVTDKAQAITDSWSGPVTGYWTDTTKWSAGVPNNDAALGNTYDVLFNATGTPYIVRLGAVISINSLELNAANANLSVQFATLDLNGGSLSVDAGTFSFGNSTIRNATISVGSTGTFAVTANFPDAILDHVSLASNLTLAWGSIQSTNGLTLGNITLSVAGGLIFIGANQTLGGTGTVNLDSGLTSEIGGANLSIGSGITVVASNLTNRITFAQNAGTITMAGNTTVNGNWINTGVIRLGAGSVTQITGTFVSASLGTIINNGGYLYFNGVLNNTGTSLDLATCGFLRIGGTINGGTIASSNGEQFAAESATLNGVTIAANGAIDGVTINNNLTLSNATLDGDSFSFSSTITILGNQSINGNGSITFGAFANEFGITNTIRAGNLTIGPGIMIGSTGFVRGGGATLALSANNLINYGVINNSNPSLTISIAASNWTNYGTISLSSGALSLTGNVTTAGMGTILRTGGEIDLRQILIDNTNAVFPLDAAHGTWVSFNSTIRGGTILSSGGAITTAGGLTLDGVTLQGDFSSAGLNGFNTSNGTTLSNATLKITTSFGNSGIFGTGTILFEHDPFIFSPPSIVAGGPVTIGSGIAIRTDTTSGNIGVWFAPQSVLNQGLISSERAGSSITFYDVLTNSGTVSATNGGTLVFGTLINSGLIYANATTVTINGPVTNTGNMSLGNSTLILYYYDPSEIGGNISHTGPTILDASLANISIPIDISNTAFGPVILGNGSSYSNVILISSNGSINLAANASIQFNATLAGNLIIPPRGTVTGNIALQNGSISLTAGNGFANLTSTNLSGNGTVVFDGAGTLLASLNLLTSATTLTIGKGVSVKGGLGLGEISATQGILNNGIINPNGQAIFIDNSLTNNGTLDVNSGKLILRANLTNNGTINIGSTGVLFINSLASPAGVISRNGGEVVLANSITGTGNVMNLGASTWGQVDLDDATLSNITLTSSQGAVSVFNLLPLSGYSSGITTFNSVSLGADVVVQPGATVVANSVLALGGRTVHLEGGSSNATLILTGLQTLTGPGQISFDGNGSTSNTITNLVSVPSGISVVTGTGGGLISTGSLTLSGTILSGTPNSTITFQNTSITIMPGGTLGAVNGGNLSVPSAVTSSGFVNIGQGSALTINGTFTQSANATIAGAGVITAKNIAGYFSIPGTVKISGTTVNIVSAMSLAGSTDHWIGKVDLGGADIIVRSITGDTSAVFNQVKQGYDNGDWGGIGGIASSLAAASSGSSTGFGIAVLTGAQYQAVTGLSTFDGQSYSPTDILLKVALVGDANLDGRINLADFNAVNSNLGAVTNSWIAGNFHYTSSIDSRDLNDVLKVFPVPEPSGRALILGAGVALAFRRRRCLNR